MKLFRNRSDAGKRLGQLLVPRYFCHGDAIVLGLPRGGVPVALAVAEALELPLDVFLVRKLGVPGHEELAMGAIASGGVRILNSEVVEALNLPPELIEAVALEEQEELQRREAAYRADRAPLQLKNQTVILVDDGLATGSSMRAAIEAVGERQPARIVVAVPVAAAATCDELAGLVNEIYCLATPDPFYAVGIWYADFAQVSDEQVRSLLQQSRRQPQQNGESERHGRS